MGHEFKESYERLDKIFSGKFVDHSKRMETLEYYNAYLSEQLSFPVEVCGTEDFPWEEFYLFGPGDKLEYESLKRTKASFTDILILTELSTKGPAPSLR